MRIDSGFGVRLGMYLAAAAITVVAVPCRAQSLDWQGFYVGVTAGAAIGTGRMEFDPTGSFNGPIAADISDGNFWRGTTKLDTTDVTGTLQAGYQIGYGRFRFGLEGEAGYLGLRESATRTATTPAGNTYRLDQEIETDFFASLRPRVGYVPEALSGDLMLFVTGGLTLTHARITQKFTQIGLDYNSNGLSEDKVLVGWTAGGGVEYALSKGWSLKAEYLYANLGTVEKNAPGNATFEAYSTRNRAELTSHILRAGAAFHF